MCKLLVHSPTVAFPPTSPSTELVFPSIPLLPWTSCIDRPIDCTICFTHTPIFQVLPPSFSQGISSLAIFTSKSEEKFDWVQSSFSFFLLLPPHEMTEFLNLELMEIYAHLFSSFSSEILPFVQDLSCLSQEKDDIFGQLFLLLRVLEVKKALILNFFWYHFH